jgi:hypothetical protein
VAAVADALWGLLAALGREESGPPGGWGGRGGGVRGRQGQARPPGGWEGQLGESRRQQQLPGRRQQQQRQARPQDQDQDQQLRPPDPLVCLQPPLPAQRTQQLLQQAGAHPAAVAAVAVALHAAPLGAPLWRPPGSRPAAVGQLLGARPALLTGKETVARCQWLAALAADCPPVAAHLAAASSQELGRALALGRARMALLDYLAATRPPEPWPYSPRRLLTSTTAISVAQLQGAWPGFADWYARTPGRGAGERPAGAPQQ